MYKDKYLIYPIPNEVVINNILSYFDNIAKIKLAILSKLWGKSTYESITIFDYTLFPNNLSKIYRYNVLLKLSNLTSLDVGTNSVFYISPNPSLYLQSLTKLKTLTYLGNTEYKREDTDSLSYLTNLTCLNIIDCVNPICDILLSLTKLKSLIIAIEPVDYDDDNEVHYTSFEKVLPKMTQLTHLDINYFEDIKFTSIQNLTNLTKLRY